jgi:ribosomal protein S18 acetylase RimI-like enzyme
MRTPVVVRAVSHSEAAIAERIHAVQMRAYNQEAELLGAVYFPPLERTVADIQGSSESFIAAFRNGDLVGALSYCQDEEGLGINISSLVVDPPHQRQRIGRQLLDAFLAIHSDEVTVQTGVKNSPALALYRQCGFTEYRRWFVGQERLELVKLRRHAGSGADAA